METNILLESGTNELEILEFRVGGNYYGMNVAKIKEILTYKKPTPVPNGHPCIEGIFMPRDIIISIIDLAKCLHLAPSKDESHDMFIVTNFNQLHTAFHVHEVVGIHRVSWADIIKPDKTINTKDSSIATGIIKVDNKLIIILDIKFNNDSIRTILKLTGLRHNIIRIKSISTRNAIFLIHGFGCFNILFIINNR